jgi:hypothetical protein
MKIFKCKSKDKSNINLSEPERVSELYDLIKDTDEDFMLEWHEKLGFSSKLVTRRKIIINNNIKELVKSGEISISSEK